jgi:hypothetical protein
MTVQRRSSATAKVLNTLAVFLVKDINLSVAVRRCSPRTASYLGTELGTDCPTRQRGRTFYD